MRFILTLLSLALVAFLYLQRAQHQTKPSEAVKPDFIAGFKTLFVTNCSGADQGKSAACACILDEMEKAKAIQYTSEDLDKMQMRLDTFLNSPAGPDAKRRCSWIETGKPTNGEGPPEEPPQDPI